MISLVAAFDQNRGLGINSQMAWHIKEDLQHFRTLTTTCKPNTQNLVIMGRITWDSLPDAFRPLPHRLNVVISRNQNLIIPNVLVKNSLQDLLAELPTLCRIHSIDQIFVIGGSQLYTQIIQLPLCTTLYLTEIHSTITCDAYFPDFQNRFYCTEKSELKKEGMHPYHFSKWKRNPPLQSNQ
ncbi:MAG: dihydrofolate reductase [Candidatus Margulisbacteria bacterium]|nr:dihydrofolate reductase [Candidatus Margulisiibacteriota bacterium]